MIEGGPQLRDRLAPDLITTRLCFFRISNYAAVALLCYSVAVRMQERRHISLTGRMAAGAAVLDLTVDDDAANVCVTVAPGALASYMSQERASIG